MGGCDLSLQSEMQMGSCRAAPAIASGVGASARTCSWDQCRALCPGHVGAPGAPSPSRPDRNGQNRATNLKKKDHLFVGREGLLSKKEPELEHASASHALRECSERAGRAGGAAGGGTKGVGSCGRSTGNLRIGGTCRRTAPLRPLAAVHRSVVWAAGTRGGVQPLACAAEPMRGGAAEGANMGRATAARGCWQGTGHQLLSSRFAPAWVAGAGLR